MVGDLRDVTLLVVVDGFDPAKGRGAKIRVVQWVKDGQSTAVLLEKREFYRDEAGEVKMGKAKGFSVKDMEAIMKSLPKIRELMRNPPPVPVESKPDPEPDAAGLDEVTF